MKVILTKKELEKCMQFAENSVDSSLSHYKRRNNTSRSRIIQDIYTGKCGEIGVYKILKSLGYEVNQPDFEIYEGRKKSFNADMTYGNYNIHCKAQNEESATKYGISWILQYGGSGWGHTDKLFKNRSKFDILAPTLIIGDEVQLFGLIRVDDLFKKDMIKMPSCKWFADTKRAIYYDDIKSLSHYNKWRRMENDSI